MNDSEELRGWSSREKLPEGFTEWLKEIVTEREASKLFGKIAEELGVDPSLLSRWIAGFGPLNQHDIDLLASKLSPVIYTYLHIPRPDNT